MLLALAIILLPTTYFMTVWFVPIAKLVSLQELRAKIDNVRALKVQANGVGPNTFRDSIDTFDWDNLMREFEDLKSRLGCTYVRVSLESH
jgi:hypothetical protein